MSEGRTLDNSLVRSSATELIWDAVLGSFAEVWQFLTKQGKSTQKDWENKAVKIRGSREAWKCPFSLLLESRAQVQSGGVLHVHWQVHPSLPPCWWQQIPEGLYSVGIFCDQRKEEVDLSHISHTPVPTKERKKHKTGPSFQGEKIHYGATLSNLIYQLT